MSKPLPARFDSLQEVCKEILSKSSIMNLRNSAEGKKMSTASQPRPVEAQYQVECSTGDLPIQQGKVYRYPEWSRTRNGRVDFYICHGLGIVDKMD